MQKTMASAVIEKEDRGGRRRTGGVLIESSLLRRSGKPGSKELPPTTTRLEYRLCEERCN